MHQISRKIISEEAIDTALRLIHLDWLSHAESYKISQWLWKLDWFPHLKWCDEITRLVKYLPSEWQIGKFCDPQIVIQFPHNPLVPEPEITFHTDEEPTWADGKKYLRIVGVPLTIWRPENGGLIFKDNNHVSSPRLNPGDAIMFTPDQFHSGGINRRGLPRYAIYFRWLEL
jgi:hypothetical protein